MEEQLISFETAKLAKEKGFNESCIHWFHSDSKKHGVYSTSYRYQEAILNKEVSRPTQSLLQKWLREVHNIQVVVIPFAEDSCDENSKCIYCSYVNEKQFYGFINKEDETCFKTWEEALETGLLEALNLI